MDPERQRIQADLRGLLKGDVRCDDLFLQLYASDASIFEIKPLAVVRPRHSDDVVACVQYARENKLPIHARGAGSGLSGESLGPGLVMDFSRYMRRLIRDDGDTVCVQPGVTLERLNRYLAHSGRVYGPDPANRRVTTMGGLLAIDGSGSRWLRYGSARRTVRSFQAVLADGTQREIGQHALVAADGTPVRDPLVNRVESILTANHATIEAGRRRSLLNRCGYQLHDVLQNGSLDLARMLVGSEGTLALFTEARVAVDTLPAHSGVIVLLFERLELAARAAWEIGRTGISACDLLDRRLLSLATEMNPQYARWIPEGTEALLLVEHQADSAADVRQMMQQIDLLVRRRKRWAFHSHLALEPDEREFFWDLPTQVVPMLYRLKGPTRPLPFVEDVAIPPVELPSFVLTLQNILKKHQTTASLFAHAGHGQLHIRPFLDLANPTDVERLRALALDLYQAVMDIGGTISGEHGDGLSRSWFLRRQYGPLYDVMIQIKQAFDSQNVFNPGKVITDQEDPPMAPIRAVVEKSPQVDEPESPAPETEEKFERLPILGWQPGELTYAARECTGCAGCRSTISQERMCPVFRMAPAEEASPRAKANLVRGLMTAQLENSHWTSAELKSVADLCFHCHQCRFECPAEVDIPRLMLEAKAQYVATNGLAPGEWFFARLDNIARWASLVRPLANWALENPTLRWWLSRLVGLAAERKLPRLARNQFLRQAARLRLHRASRRTERKVAYFVDVYANWFDTELAESLVKILEHNGVTVFVPSTQLQSGMPLIAMGSVEAARKLVRHNVKILAEAIRQGYHIVTTEPAAALALTHEYRNLQDDEDAQLIATHTSDACDYLWRLHEQGLLELDFNPVHLHVGYHLPCHQRALKVGTPGEKLLRLVPGLTVSRIQSGCSGMAGTYGLMQKNYRSSLRMGRDLIRGMRAPAVQVGSTECSACKLQMEQGESKPTLHPLKLLAYSYGVLPEMGPILNRTSGELIVS
ncbi:MAG: FAD-linked oxidase C-terminal domain-containing protein [Pirellulales bacterium]